MKTWKFKKIIKLCNVLACEFAELLQKIRSTISKFLCWHRRWPRWISETSLPLAIWLFSAEKLQKCFLWCSKIVFDDPEKISRPSVEGRQLSLEENFYVLIYFRKQVFRLFHLNFRFVTSAIIFRLTWNSFILIFINLLKKFYFILLFANSKRHHYNYKCKL